MSRLKYQTPNSILRSIRSWPQLRKKLYRIGTKEKGDVFERLVQLYLTLTPKYATQLLSVWLLSETPLRVRRKLNLPASDEGIDLIAETRSGEYWSIQAKYRHEESSSLTWREISTFEGLSFGISKGISFGLICTTTERVAKLLKGQPNVGFCDSEVWNSLDKDFWGRVRSAVAGRKPKLRRRKPRPYQRQAINAAKKHFVKQKESRGKLIMPCGTGKSLMGYWISRTLKARTVVVAVPSLSLIRQLLDDWPREIQAARIDAAWLCVCSDQSIKDAAFDDAVVLPHDLGVEVHTDPTRISSWLRSNRSRLRVVFTTYQSGRVLARAARKASARFDLGIMDEAHKTTGQKDRSFSHLLFDKNVPIRQRVFMTATERRFRGSSDEIVSMDDPKVYGDTFFLLSFKRALECKPPILSDYQVLTIAVGRSEVEDLIKQRAFVLPKGESWKTLDAATLAAVVALRKAMKRYGITHAVSFHRTIRRAKEFQAHNDAFSRSVRRFGKVDAYHVSGVQSTAERRAIIREFIQTRRSVVTNARCLTEGINVPEIDCVLFADPKGSTIDIVQAAGRAMRPKKDGRLGYVVVPLLTDEGMTVERLGESSAFKDVLFTLRALASQDDRIIEYFRSIASIGQRPTRSPINIEIPRELISETVDVGEFARSVELRCWGRLGRLSWRKFSQAREYARQLGLRKDPDWPRYCRGEFPNLPSLPPDIPHSPHWVYRESGWVGYWDWLGTGRTPWSHKKLRPFEKARRFVHSLRLKNQKEWGEYCRGELKGKPKLPPDIPARPHFFYEGKGWKRLGDWLGTGSVATRKRKYRSFRSARQFARSLGLKSVADWKAYAKTGRRGLPKWPADIPANPAHQYTGKGWVNYGDWLGTGKVATKDRNFWSFKKARAFIHALKLATNVDYRKYSAGKMSGAPSSHGMLPSNPDTSYKGKGWISWGDFLGTGVVADKKKVFWPFKKARSFVRSLKLRSNGDWRRWGRGELPGRPLRPTEMPGLPERVYRNSGWAGWGDFLGTGREAFGAHTYLPFKKARKFVHHLKLNNTGEWRDYYRGQMTFKPPRPPNIPKSPHEVYKGKGWKGMRHWLGLGIQ